MVEISLSGSGEGPGWVTAPGYSTAGFSAMSGNPGFCQVASQARGGLWGAVRIMITEPRVFNGRQINR